MEWGVSDNLHGLAITQISWSKHESIYYAIWNNHKVLGAKNVRLNDSKLHIYLTYMHNLGIYNLYLTYTPYIYKLKSPRDFQYSYFFLQVFETHCNYSLWYLRYWYKKYKIGVTDIILMLYSVSKVSRNSLFSASKLCVCISIWIICL